VTVPAALHGSQTQGWPANTYRSRARSAILAAGACIFLPAPASAQVGTAVSIFSDDRFRGYSISGGHPVGLLDLSYDAAGGVYANVSASVVASSGDGLRPLGLQVNGGYAKRLSSSVTLDLGVVHSNYTHYSSRGSARSYTEAYAGLTGKLVSTRLYLSPDYLKPHAWTLYGEVDGNLPVATRLRLLGHIGMLVPLRSGGDGEDYRREIDWRVGVARDFGPISLHLAWTGVRPGHDPYRNREHGRSALILGLSYAL
jgi:uncharacterized protein (TIGR02001 family)